MAKHIHNHDVPTQLFGEERRMFESIWGKSDIAAILTIYGDSDKFQFVDRLPLMFQSAVRGKSVHLFSNDEEAEKFIRNAKVVPSPIANSSALFFFELWRLQEAHKNKHIIIQI